MKVATINDTWRVGSKNTLNVYRGGSDKDPRQSSVCQCHNEQDAALIVTAVNVLRELAEMNTTPELPGDLAVLILLAKNRVQRGIV